MKTLYMEGLDSEAFEELCEEIFSKFYKAKVKRNFLFGNHGTDFVILSKNEIAVDCKHPIKVAVGKPTVEKFYLAMKKKKVKEGIIVTSGRFASTAQKYIDENNLPITLMNLDRLSAMAYKVGIKLVVEKDDEPEVYTILSNSDREFRDHLSKRSSRELDCSEDIYFGMSIIKRDIQLIPFYKINYILSAEFKVSDRVIHKEKDEGYYYINERTGKVEDEEFRRIFDLAPRMAYSPKNKAVASKPKKIVTDTLYKTVQEAHTKYVPYKTKADKLTTKKCTPARKDITIQNVMCLYLPLSDVEYELFGKTRYIRSLESNSEDFIIIEPKINKCDICNGRISGKGIMCVNCGNMCDDKHGVRCSRCNKTLCINCALYVSKFLGKKEPICGTCANKEPGLKIKSYK